MVLHPVPQRCPLGSLILSLFTHPPASGCFPANALYLELLEDCNGAFSPGEVAGHLGVLRTSSILQRPVVIDWSRSVKARLLCLPVWLNLRYSYTPVFLMVSDSLKNFLKIRLCLVCLPSLICLPHSLCDCSWKLIMCPFTIVLVLGWLLEKPAWWYLL